MKPQQRPGGAALALMFAATLVAAHGDESHALQPAAAPAA